jgi:hypothetical protein
VNADLAKLKDTDSVSGADSIKITATDSFGNAAMPANIAITVGAPGAPAFVAAMAGLGGGGASGMTATPATITVPWQAVHLATGGHAISGQT